MNKRLFVWKSQDIIRSDGVESNHRLDHRLRRDTKLRTFSRKVAGSNNFYTRVGEHTMRKAIILTIICLVGSLTASANIKIKTKQTMGGQTYENATYIKGKRQRSETMGGTMVSITQCDLKRSIQMHPSAKTFVVNEFGDIEPADTSKPIDLKSQPVVKGGKVISTFTVKDAGERKNMFGFTARRLLITMESESTPEACSRIKTKMETDGWYIDFDFNFDCDQSYAYRAPSANGGGCRDKYEMKTIGSAKRGYPVYEKMTFFDESGKETMTMVSEVVELSKATLDAALFEVPSDYRQVSDSSQLYASAASPSAGSSIPSVGGGSSSGSSGTLQLPNIAANTSSAAASSGEVGSKKEGITRIGIATVKTGSVGDGVTAADLAAAIHNTLAAYLKMPNIEIVPIEARLATAIESEARSKECDFVINASVSHKKGGGGFGMFSQALGSAASLAGYGGGVAGMVAGQVASTAISSAAVSGSFKAKDEITLEIKMTNGAGASALAKSYKSKAKSNGDDIISQVVEQAATAIAAIAAK